jgi:UDP-GlcNAc3NAcA epimerase
VTLRDETEWVELIELGWNRLASPARSEVAQIIKAALGTRGVDAQPYGDGKVGEVIANILTRRGASAEPA